MVPLYPLRPTGLCWAIRQSAKVGQAKQGVCGALLQLQPPPLGWWPHTSCWVCCRDEKKSCPPIYDFPFQGTPRQHHPAHPSSHESVDTPVVHVKQRTRRPPTRRTDKDGRRDAKTNKASVPRDNRRNVQRKRSNEGILRRTGRECPAN